MEIIAHVCEASQSAVKGHDLSHSVGEKDWFAVSGKACIIRFAVGHSFNFQFHFGAEVFHQRGRKSHSAVVAIFVGEDLNWKINIVKVSMPRKFLRPIEFEGHYLSHVHE